MFKTILLPVDLGEESSWTKALPAALFHVRASGGNVTVMTVIPSFGEGVVATYFPADFAEQAMAQAKKDIEAFRAEHMPPDVKSNALARRGTIYDEILSVAEEIDADLIVMASHRPTLQDYLLGPNAARVVRHAKRSVLVVREKATGE
jgi:nucleotide-binding universal stress UspA family protein